MKALSLVVMLWGLAANAAAETLTVTVDGFREAQGRFIIAVFNSKETYLERGVANRQVAVETTDPMTFVFEDLPPGEYAVAAYHDVNNNGYFDLGALALNREPFAFSNDLRPRVRRPKFDQGKFTVEGETAIAISLVHGKSMRDRLRRGEDDVEASAP